MNGDTVIITGIALGLFCAIALFGIIIAIVFSGKKTKKQKSGKSCAKCVKAVNVSAANDSGASRDTETCSALIYGEAAEQKPDSGDNGEEETKAILGENSDESETENLGMSGSDSVSVTEAENCSEPIYGEAAELEPDSEDSREEEAEALLSEISSESADESNRISEPEQTAALKKVYRRSFEARLIESGEQTKKLYSVLKNGIMSYVGINDRMSVKHEKFFRGKITFAKIGFRRKTLCVYFAVPVKELKAEEPEISATSGLTDVSDIIVHTKTPALMQINAGGDAERAGRLLKITADKLKIRFGAQSDYDYESDYPSEDMQALIERGLIRVGYVRFK